MRARSKPDSLVGSRWRGRKSGIEMTVTCSSRRKIVAMSDETHNGVRIQSTNKPADFRKIFERIEE